MARKKLKAHPVADLFPMLPDDELAELAADVAERGLLQPIVLDSEGHVLDGRNRLAACEKASVEPTFVTYDGDDPSGYALAVNIARRHLSKGQQAMVIALSGVEYRNDTGNGPSKQRVAHARQVRDHAPDLADSVASGTVPLDTAYETARERKKAAESTETQMAGLRSEAPDLADLVTEERLTLAGALSELRAREAQRESELRAGENCVRSVLTYLTSEVLTPGELADSYADVLDRFDPKQLDFAAQTMAAIAGRTAHGQE